MVTTHEREFFGDDGVSIKETYIEEALERITAAFPSEVQACLTDLVADKIRRELTVLVDASIDMVRGFEEFRD